MVDIDPALAKKSASDLADGGVDVRLEVGDVAEPEVADAAARLAIDTWGRIDILVNNAGIGGINRNIWELPVEEMDRVYRTNLRGVYVFCGAIIPHMLERGYGRIVNIASVAGKEGNPRAAPYSATKAGVIALTKSAGKELAGTGVRVNCVTPAVVETRLLDEFTPEQVQYMLSRVPMGRFVEIDEIAALVAWLSSSECSFSTGAVFDITGGRSTY
jgi:3-oxoacyl-[acyl-carrier protein] reductase